MSINLEAAMVKRRGDKAPEPPGGRAAERLRMFEQARQPNLNKDFTSKAKPIADSMEKTRGKKSERPDANKTRRKDR
jgi:hypothetical protein